MGNDSSKDIKDIADALDVQKDLTPVNQLSHINFPVDPRSPTVGIERTPIEIRKEALDIDVNVLRKRWKSETDISPHKEVKSSIHLLKDDPRSPTLGIMRTPILVSCSLDKSSDKNSYSKKYSCDDMQICKRNLILKTAMEDCRSPSLGISRTPIQVPVSPIKEESVCKSAPDSKPCDERAETTTSVTPWVTPFSKKFFGSGPFVYTDEENIETKIRNDTKSIEYDTNHEKENDLNLKRKLVFTPEPNKTGIKVRTPLGSRGNFQDSPSQYLKIMQVQKLGQDVGVSSDNVLSITGSCTKGSSRKSVGMEWDKDKTLIL